MGSSSILYCFIEYIFSPTVAFFAFINALLIYFFFPKKLHKQYHKGETKNLNDREERKSIVATQT
jgi:CPA2 family monovalent cation:H+ antiporter-2